MFSFLCISLLLAALVHVAPAAGSLPLRELPRLNLTGTVSISGISSGADLAVQFHVANSDIINASAIFAGQAFACAIHRMDVEPQFACSEQPAGAQGPGCVGMPWGPAPCIGCDGGNASQTVAYDHCKSLQGAAWTQVPRLVQYAQGLAAAGAIPPLANLADDGVYLYRGTFDTTYEAGSVNRTQEFFLSLGVAKTAFEASIPSAHCWPTADPAISPASCNNNSAGPPAMENCGYDGAGAALQFVYGDSLAAPASLSDFDPANALPFEQFPYEADVAWAGQGREGYLYVPAACAAPQLAPCRLHVALHGCGMSASNAAMGDSFYLHTGLNAWAESNDLVILYPNMGGFIDFNITAPSSQLGGGCFDGYGQTGADFASTTGSQMLTIRNMIAALYGGAEGFARGGIKNLFTPTRTRGDSAREGGRGDKENR